MNKLFLYMLVSILAASALHAQKNVSAFKIGSDFQQAQLMGKQVLLPDLSEFNNEFLQETVEKNVPDLQSSGTKSQTANIDPALIWKKLEKIPGLLEHKILPDLHAIVECIVARIHSQDQLTIVNDVLDLEQQAQDERSQILDLINRYGQIYTCDPQRAQQLYTLITQKLALLKSIHKHMQEIKSQYIK